ncbi:DEAD/DEAH box helicase [Desulfococcaceae bacterium HSG9]|nr:DEAD/DEAH box helicase [Desulfococcaceae bacterium HSG9]
MKPANQRRSHPHPQSDLVAHGQAVAVHIQAILATNLAPPYQEMGHFLANIIGSCHDLLKDTSAFQAHLDGAASNHLSRHSGGSAVLAYLITRAILRQKTNLFENFSLRSLLPHIVFAVIAAHHGKLKQTDIDKEHAASLHHWQKTRSHASEALIQQVTNQYKIKYTINTLNGDLAELEEEIFELDTPEAEISGENFFCAFLLCKMCLGAIAWADADSAARQTHGIPEPAVSEPEICESRFAVTPPAEDAANSLNQLRTLFQDQVCENWQPDFPVLLLKAPTGLGKTVAVSRLTATIQKSIGTSKVFYMAPTTAILNQVAEEIFSFNRNGNNMLLHYLARELTDSRRTASESQYNPEQVRERTKRFERLDAGLVVTTYHRALSVLGGMSKNSCTALFNLKNSIWILDECQFLSHIQFGVFALICSVLHRLCGAVPIFMSATPPSSFLWQKAHDALHWPAFPELMPLLTEQQLWDLENNDFVDGRRKIHPCPEIVNIDDLTAKIKAYRKENHQQSVLVLVNLAKDAVSITRDLGKTDYTITNYLRPRDIKEQLAEAALRLKDDEPILMIATSIVQAGVDLDFDTGFVELNDLRSFRQGCGRVGRNFIAGRGACPVFAFDLRDHNQRSSWFRQRFHRMIHSKTVDKVKETYKQIIENSVAEVLESQHSLSDSEIEAIEARYEKEIPRIFEAIEKRMLHFWSDYGTLLQNNSGQGFDFHKIEQFLTDDLNDNESASPFIVVFTSADADERDKLMQSLSELKKIGRQIDFGGSDFYERLKSFRNLKKEIFRYIAPILCGEWIYYVILKNISKIRSYGRNLIFIWCGSPSVMIPKPSGGGLALKISSNPKGGSDNVL